MFSVDTFIDLWAYRVPPQKADEFGRLYGSEGAWVRLFRQAPGYLDTHLYRDRNDAYRYVTVDRWESEEAFRAFRVRFAEEFEHLDIEGEHLTVEETPLGEFGSIDISRPAGISDPDIRP